jgi:uncharacterized protein
MNQALRRIQNMDRRSLMTKGFATICAGAIAPAAIAIETQPAPPNHVWQTAPDVRGAIPWSLLSQATEDVRLDANRMNYVEASFPPAVAALNGRVVRVNGYIMPLQQSDQQTHFVLMAYPPSCPFCMTAGPQYLIEVRTARPIRFNYDAIVIEGTLTTLVRDPQGFFYRITNARLAPR